MYNTSKCTNWPLTILLLIFWIFALWAVMTFAELSALGIHQQRLLLSLRDENTRGLCKVQKGEIPSRVLFPDGQQDMMDDDGIDDRNGFDDNGGFDIDPCSNVTNPCCIDRGGCPEESCFPFYNFVGSSVTIGAITYDPRTKQMCRISLHVAPPGTPTGERSVFCPDLAPPPNRPDIECVVGLLFFSPEVRLTMINQFGRRFGPFDFEARQLAPIYLTGYAREQAGRTEITGFYAFNQLRQDSYEFTMRTHPSLQ